MEFLAPEGTLKKSTPASGQVTCGGLLPPGGWCR